MMIYFKECPKCHGDLYAGEDVHGRHVSCIQCGCLRDLPVANTKPLFGETFVIEAPKTAKKKRKQVRQTA